MIDRLQTAHLTAGAAKTDITPSELTGLNPMGVSFDAVHDPIFLRALVLGDGTRRCAVIAADLIEVGDTKEIRARVERELGIPADAIIIAPSHSHNAPRIGLVPPGGKARIPSPESLEYTETVYESMIATVQRACEAAQPARLGVGRDVVDVNVNRNEYVEGRFVLGYNPDGPSDKTVTVLSLQSLDGTPIAALINYAVHPTVTLGTGQLGGDLAGVAARHVEEQLCGGAVALWTSGPLGDQAARVQFAHTEDFGRDCELANAAAAAQGLLIGATALRAMQRIDAYAGDIRVTGAGRVVPCPARRLEVPPGMEQADVATVELTLGCITIGDIALTGISGEITVPLYRALTAASPLATTLAISNANARIGYLPEDEAYPARTQQAEGCPIVEGYAAKTIIRGLVELIAASRRTSPAD